jgi:hypothetical protein
LFCTSTGTAPIENAITALKTLVKQLNETSYIILKRLMEFLTIVASHSDENKMTGNK